MNYCINELLSLLPNDELTDKERDAIRRILPVPKEQVVLWARLIDGGGHPSGYVITDKAFIYKASKQDVKIINESIKQDNKGKKHAEKTSKIKYIYKVIPWEHYSPDLITFCSSKDKDEDRYSIIGEDGMLFEIDASLYNFFSQYNEKLNRIEKERLSQIAALGTVNSLATGDVMYNINNGTANTQAGHGFYAEDAGAFLDRLHGEKSIVVGGDNAKNGADKIVNGINVQCKYYNSANGSIDACFSTNKDGTRKYRYFDLNDKPMQVEVPSDQYPDAIKRMRERITKGEVPGVTDPDKAVELVRKGRLTYAQARNLAKAGTIESIVFDAKNSAINCFSALGISALASFAITLWKTKSYAEAAYSAVKTGIQVYGLSFTGSILASQVARTRVPKAVQPFFNWLSLKIGPQRTQSVINVFRRVAGKKAVYGAAAQNNFVKLLSSNFVAESIMFIVFSIPDAYRVISGKISKAQFAKNLVSLLASIGGAAGGAYGGAALGAKIGRWGGPLAFIGGTAGGAVAGTATHLALDLFREDDAVIMGRMINEYIRIGMIDYMLNEEEQNAFIELLNNDRKGLKKLVNSLYGSENQELAINNHLNPLFKKVTKKREKICIEKESIVRNGLMDRIGRFGYAL